MTRVLSSAKFAVSHKERANGEGGTGRMGEARGALARQRTECEGVARRYRVIALDWPGHGASDSEAAEPTDERYSEHLAAFVEALGLEQITLIGNSVGGAAAIRFASSRPENVRALIVANPAGLFMRPPGFSLLLKLVSRIFAAGAAGARWFPSVFAAYYKRILWREPAAEQRARIVAAGYELAPMLARAWYGFGQPSADVRSLAAQVRCPVLVAWSVRDPANKLWMNRAGIARFPDRQLVEFDGGHTPFLEMPDQFVSTFDAFMHRIGLAAIVRVPKHAKTGGRRRSHSKRTYERVARIEHAHAWKLWASAVAGCVRRRLADRPVLV